MKERLGLNLVTLGGEPTVDGFVAKLEAAAEAGFAGVGVWLRDVQAWQEAGRSLDELKGLLSDKSLVIHEMCFVTVYDGDAVSPRPDAFELAAEIGCPTVLVIQGHDKPLETMQADWAAFLEPVKDLGIRAAWEFIGPWPAFNSPGEAWQIVQAGPEIGTVCVDTYHFWRGGKPVDDLLSVPGDRIGVVHLNDVNDVPRETSQDSDRTYPGEGVMPLGEMFDCLDKIGYQGPFSTEIFGACQQEPIADAAKKAYAGAAKVLGA